MAEKIKVLIADDHALIRKGLIKTLSGEDNLNIVGEAQNGLEAIEKARELKPDIVIMDIFMPQCGGLEATATISNILPGTKIIILTVSERSEDLFKALRLGAQAYLLKTSPAAEVVDAIKKSVAGETALSSNILTRLVTELRGKKEGSVLSSRENEILELLGMGLTNYEISRRLFISESTVRTHIYRLLEKLHLRNRNEAAAYAARHHLGTQLDN